MAAAGERLDETRREREGAETREASRQMKRCDDVVGEVPETEIKQAGEGSSDQVPSAAVLTL